MKSRFRLLFIMSILIHCLLFSGAHAAEMLACPDSIDVQETIREQPEGWMPLEEEGSHRLMKISFYDGNPQGKGELAPEREQKKKGKLYATWRFDSETVKNLWISCSYGRTAIALVKPLEKQYKSCTVVSDMSVSVGGLPAIISSECR